MRIEHFAVRSEFLQKYVDYYYRLSTVGDQQSFEYLAFPSGNTPLGFFTNASLLKSNKKIKMNFSMDSPLKVLLVGNSLKPLDIKFELGIAEFAVVFKPLGINHFVRQNLGALLCEDVSIVRFFDEFLPAAKNLVEGIDALDEFEEKLISAFRKDEELEFLATVITKFQETEFARHQSPLMFNTSSKRLFRLFKKHLGVNPTQFRQLLRFRAAVDLSLENLEKRNLTEIGFCAGYYDQPHFIKEFKRITNLTPRDFLKKISLVANDKIAWQFLPPASESYN